MQVGEIFRMETILEDIVCAMACLEPGPLAECCTTCFVRPLLRMNNHNELEGPSIVGSMV